MGPVDWSSAAYPWVGFPKVSWATIWQLFPKSEYPTEDGVARADWEERRMLVAELQERKKH